METTDEIRDLRKQVEQLKAYIVELQGMLNEEQTGGFNHDEA